MKTWRVEVTTDVRNDLDNYVYYLVTEKLSMQAAVALLADFDETVEELKIVAGTLRIIEDSELNDYRKIRLRRHNYYLVYRVEDETAIVDKMFHDLQDFDDTLK